MREHADEKNRRAISQAFKKEVHRLKKSVDDRAAHLEVDRQRERDATRRDASRAREEAKARLEELRSKSDAIVSVTTSLDSLLVHVRRVYRGEDANALGLLCPSLVAQ